MAVHNFWMQLRCRYCHVHLGAYCNPCILGNTKFVLTLEVERVS
jgi:hypothetical protein